MRNGRRLTRRHRAQTGFAYVLLLVAVAMIGLAASASITLGSALARRDAELHLLAIGMEMQNALRSYVGISSSSQVRPVGLNGPRNLEVLLKDPRSLGVRRHLRQIYDDPMTGTSDWGLVKDSEGFITGVYSLAQGQPIRRERFEPVLTGFNQAGSYKQWVFGLPAIEQPRDPAGTNAFR